MHLCAEYKRSLTSYHIGRVVQLVAHLTHEPEVPGLTLSFLFPLIQEGQLSVSGESMCMKYMLTA